MSQVIFNIDPLKAMTASLQANRKARVQVGCLGNKASRFSINTYTGKKQINNPTLGLVHEFGSASLNIPARSFLRMPLISELPKKLAQIGRAVWTSLIERHGVYYALEQLAIAAEGTIQQAFATGGFGRWQALKASTIRRKGSTSILIDSGMLRKSVSSRIVGGQRP